MARSSSSVYSLGGELYQPSLSIRLSHCLPFVLYDCFRSVYLLN